MKIKQQLSAQPEKETPALQTPQAPTKEVAKEKLSTTPPKTPPAKNIRPSDLMLELEKALQQRKAYKEAQVTTPDTDEEQKPTSPGQKL